MSENRPKTEKNAGSHAKSMLSKVSFQPQIPLVHSCGKSMCDCITLNLLSPHLTNKCTHEKKSLFAESLYLMPPACFEARVACCKCTDQDTQQVVGIMMVCGIKAVHSAGGVLQI